MSLSRECEKCGSHLPGDTVKCLICGHMNGRTCTSCGAGVPTGERICQVCGLDLGPELALSDLHDDDSRVRVADRDSPAPDPHKAPEPDPVNEEPAVAFAPPPIPPAAQTPEGHSPHLADEMDALKSKATRPLPTAEPEPPQQNDPPPTERRPTALNLNAPSANHTDRMPKKMDTDDYSAVIDSCRGLIRNRFDLYGVFGRPEAGKTCFIYALGRVIKGIPGLRNTTGQFTLDANWEDLIRYQERLFDQGVNAPTARGLHFYKANAVGGFRKRHFAMIDVRGEQFEQIEDWNKEVTDFFMTYLSHCKGLFLFLDLDPDTVAPGRGHVFERLERERGRELTPDERERIGEAYEFKRNQMSHMVSFLSVAATIPRAMKTKDFLKQRSELALAARETKRGSQQLRIPVSLCISKADLMKDRRFEGYPAVVPGSDSFYGDPWNVVETFFGNELENMKRLAPYLKVEWVSSTGENFNPKRGISRPMGVGSVFNHVVNPMPAWAASAGTYEKLRRFFFPRSDAQ